MSYNRGIYFIGRNRDLAYSLDLRQRVVDTVREEGATQEEVALRFKVSVSSLKRWLNRENLVADKPGPRESRTINAEELKAVVAAKPDAFLDEYAVLLNSKPSTVSYNLLKLGISRKKNNAVCRTTRGRA
jgi:transposase